MPMSSPMMTTMLGRCPAGAGTGAGCCACAIASELIAPAATINAEPPSNILRRSRLLLGDVVWFLSLLLISTPACESWVRMDESRCIEFDDSPGLALFGCIVDLDSQITTMLVRPQLRMSCRNRRDRLKKLDLGPPCRPDKTNRPSPERTMAGLHKEAH